MRSSTKRLVMKTSISSDETTMHAPEGTTTLLTTKIPLDSNGAYLKKRTKTKVFGEAML